VIENELAPIDPFVSFASTGLGNFDSTNPSLNSFGKSSASSRGVTDPSLFLVAHVPMISKPLLRNARKGGSSYLAEETTQISCDVQDGYE